MVADMKLQGFYLCLEKKSLKKKDGSTYLNLLLQDKSGLIRARIWDNVQKLSKKNLFKKVWTSNFFSYNSC